MKALMKTTKSASPATVDKKWVLIDAEGLVVGRLASTVANILRGKHKTSFTPHVDCGDNVIIINAGKVKFTGKKLTDKVYYHHTGYPGGIKAITAGKLLKEKPEEVLRTAVKGMLPKNTLGRAMLKKLKIYAGGDHPHEAQSPRILEL